MISPLIPKGTLASSWISAKSSPEAGPKKLSLVGRPI